VQFDSHVLWGWKLNAVVRDKLHHVYLSLGSNISPELNLPKALDALQSLLDIKATSTAWESPPYGGEGPNFINSIVQVVTNKEINEFRTRVLRPIEAQLGRVRGEDPNSPRPIDLDILIFDDNIIDPSIWYRPYLAIPLAELIPELENPLTGESLADIAKQLMNESLTFPRPEVQNLKLSIPDT
jgi:2-amino-4-hydroxy-6-hydroxymethyldihydropteridine diphosphokinase